MTDTRIIFYDLYFAQSKNGQKAVMVHELGHAWDAAMFGLPSYLMKRVTKSTYDGDGIPFVDKYIPGGQTTTYAANNNHFEDFAEAVTAVVYPSIGEYKNVDTARTDYVKGIMGLPKRPPVHPCRRCE